ncbi:MAG: ABC transporter permease [Acidimicrobiales bacterium]
MVLLENALLGVIFGGVYALSASGIVLTYTSTGVFNVAHFTIALFSAYVGWQLNGVWGLPLWVAAPLTLLVCGPILGVVLERVVFRPLQARRAGSSERLVAALGVTVLFLGLINVIWGPGVQGTTAEPVPRLFPVEPFALGTLRFDTEQLGVVATILVVGAGLYVLLHRTWLGTRIRAVVDRRELAQLSAVDSDRISQVAWALGCSLAALTGLLIAPPALEPQRIIFLGIETFSVAVVARLVSLPAALAFGFLVMGMGRAMLDGFTPFGDTGYPALLYDEAVLNLSSIVLFVALVAFRRLDEVGEVGSTGRGLVTGAFGRRWHAGPFGITTGVVLAAIALLTPALLDPGDLHLAQRCLGLVVIFVSITCITGFSGHITLGQASIAGLGAYATARFTGQFDLPVLVAMAGGAGVALLAGLAAGYPALRRKGLFLGLTTLALALLIDRFVFNAQLPIVAGGPGDFLVSRPQLLGIDLRGDTAFWYYELAVVAVVLLLAHNLRSGRLGRVLAAMRDSEVAAASVGIGLRRAKLFAFGVSSAMAGIGGALLTQADQNWDIATFNPVFGLFWFTAVVVCGVSRIRGAILAAVLYIAIPRIFDIDLFSAVGLFGLLALFQGRMPGGIVAQAERLPALLRAKVAAVYAEASEPPPPPAPEPQPSAFARRIVAERSS